MCAQAFDHGGQGQAACLALAQALRHGRTGAQLVELYAQGCGLGFDGVDMLQRADDRLALEHQRHEGGRGQCGKHEQQAGDGCAVDPALAPLHAAKAGVGHGVGAACVLQVDGGVLRKALAFAGLMLGACAADAPVHGPAAAGLGRGLPGGDDVLHGQWGDAPHGLLHGLAQVGARHGGQLQRTPQAFGLGHQQAGCLARTRHGAQAGAGKRPVAALRAGQGQARRGPGAALDEQAAEVAKTPGNPVPPEVQAAL